MSKIGCFLGGFSRKYEKFVFFGQVQEFWGSWENYLVRNFLFELAICWNVERQYGCE